jgi:hypothetical protein
VVSYRKNITRCLKGAASCRLEAEEAQSAFQEQAWLDLADDWMRLLEAFEKADHQTLH